MRPSLKNLNSANMSAPDQFYQAAMGASGVFVADSSNPFYTTTVSNLIISSITVSGGISIYSFSGSPDITEVMVGNNLIVSSCTNEVNNGEFEITAINSGASTISVINARGVAQGSLAGGASTRPFYGARVVQPLADTVFTSFVDDALGSNGYIEGQGLLATSGAVFGIITKVVVASGAVRLYCI